MPAAFEDHFSQHAGAYARHRPTYPASLFTFLAGVCAARDAAWDCATGNGQAAEGLARHFALVHATDASAEQLAHARPHPRVRYAQAPERASGLPRASVDLVTAAQAFHWLDADAFFAEARRVLRPAGVVAVWCYGRTTVSPGVDPIVADFHDRVVGSDWPAGRALVNRLYAGVPFPFDPIAAPAFAMETTLTLEEFVSYVATWSAVQRHRARTGRDPLPALRDRLASEWPGRGGTACRVGWPLGLLVGRVSR